MSTFLHYPVKEKTLAVTWEPSISTRNENQYLKISPGTINNFLPTNWMSDFVLDKDLVNYVKLRFYSTSSGTGPVITGAEFKVDTALIVPSSPKKNAPPDTSDLLIGVYYKGDYRMIFKSPIFVYPIIFYTTPKTAPVPGGESFDKYFIWQHV